VGATDEDRGALAAESVDGSNACSLPGLADGW